MGLDNYWMKDDKPLILAFEPELALVGGLGSDHGSGSFRGKVYSNYIHELTDRSLYDDLSNDDVKHIADALEKKIPEPSVDIPKGLIPTESFPCHNHHHDLTRMFRAYADAGAILLAYW